MIEQVSNQVTSYFGGHVLFHGQDQEGAFQVIERVDSRLRALHFSTAATQTLLDPQYPQQLQLEYTAVMSLALTMMDSPKRVLMIGLGGGALLQHIFHYFPELKIDVIERRQAIIDVAREYFYLPTDSRITLHCGDAQQLLANLSEGYDVIFNDAYSRFGPDIALYSSDVYQQCQCLLSEQGVLVNNLWQRRMKENQKLLRELTEHFTELAYHQDDKRRNLVVFAAKKNWQQLPWRQRCQAMAAVCQLPLQEHLRKVSRSIVLLKLRLWLRAQLSSLLKYQPM